MGTVDRVLHNRKGVSKSTIEKVREIIDQLGYQPNIFARNLALNKIFLFCALVPSVDVSDYWKGPQKGILRAAKELSSLGVQLELFYYDTFSKESFTEASEKIFQLLPDGVLLAPNLYQESLNFLINCKERQIPAVLIDSNINEEPSLSFIGQDSFQSGFLAAKLLNYGADPKGTVLTVTVGKEGNNSFHFLKRIEGFTAYFKEKNISATKIIQLEEKGDNDFLNTFQKTLEIERPYGIFIPNSRAYKIAELIESANFQTRLIGYDLTEKNLTFLEKGVIDFLINQKPEDQGYLGIFSLYKFLVLKQSVTAELKMPIEIITKENLPSS